MYGATGGTYSAHIFRPHTGGDYASAEATVRHDKLPANVIIAESSSSRIIC